MSRIGAFQKGGMIEAIENAGMGYSPWERQSLVFSMTSIMVSAGD